MGNSLPRSDLAVLLTRTADGNAAAFQRLYDQTAATLFGIIMRILREQSDSEDVLKDVYLTVWRKAGDYDAERMSPLTWIAAIARNRAIDRLRAGIERPFVSMTPHTETLEERTDGYSSVQTGTDATRLQPALAMLDPRHADVIRSCYLEGLTYEALAKREGIPLAELKRRIRCGLLQLRTQRLQIRPLA